MLHTYSYVLTHTREPPWYDLPGFRRSGKPFIVHPYASRPYTASEYSEYGVHTYLLMCIVAVHKASPIGTFAEEFRYTGVPTPIYGVCTYQQPYLSMRARNSGSRRSCVSVKVKTFAIMDRTGSHPAGSASGRKCAISDARSRSGSGLWPWSYQESRAPEYI